VRTRTGKFLLGILVALTGFGLVAPVLVVVPLSFTDKRSFAMPPSGYSARWYENFWTDDRWISALVNSLLIATASAAVATLVGVAAAVALQRFSARSRGVINAIILLPILIPSVIIAAGIYIVYLNWNLTGNFIGFVATHAVGALPLVVIPVAAALATFDRQQLSAAASLGAPPLRAFLSVALPAIAPGVMAGALFAFVHSWDELITALFISKPLLTTLPVRLYNAVANDTDPTLAAVSTMILVAVALVVLIILHSNKKREKRSHAA
jgi:ABC-type spermidine/putrescine transport system, permease component II